MADPYIAQLGLGTVLRVWDGAAFLDVPWCGAITGPDETFDTVDVTTHSSTGGYREYIAGLADGNEVTCDLNWHADDETHQLLATIQKTREVTPFQLYWPQYDEENLVDFDGFVTGLTRSSPTDAQLVRALTIKITGEPVTSTE